MSATSNKKTPNTALSKTHLRVAFLDLDEILSCQSKVALSLRTPYIQHHCTMITTLSALSHKLHSKIVRAVLEIATLEHFATS